MRRLLACMFLLTAEAASGTSLSINPIRLTLDAQHAVGSLTITNKDDHAVVMQLDAAAWTQENGRDIEVPTDDLLASPPLVSIAPGASQLVRVGLRHPSSGPQERCYRIFLQEVPQQASANQPALQLRLRFAVPVFIPGSTHDAPSLLWEAQGSNGHFTLHAHNASSQHVQVMSLSLRAGTDDVLAVSSPFYVLPGQTRSWPVAAQKQTLGTLHVATITDAGPMQTDVQQPLP